ncbi:protein tyrosine/serine phosphatase [Beutenbergia cavernae DSM 12333]|uniref:Protein tyrosine/serine phosphatase n=1 Tax=Beutenbergia cavernae (strain ATCC BAA-8 / DSM 12333 / CCUG 43141 / JCM 11478 / NBRC 16432 / NCIMB 13614 / HKI 0122) TaxID=471853 RepID=C5C689_BEUC1|nr:tyrosine-protein phosphatase [Beutenbergia cavernae]ACQ80295.1 protein tyrosine/serine phosphatase [Beutenbergia cavernae DSM 12333]
MTDSIPATSQVAVDLPGSWNARDSATLTGTRAGVLWRSATLSELTDAGRARLAELGVRTVVDLRSPVEVERDGVDTAGGDVTVHALPVTAGAQVPGAVVAAEHHGGAPSGDGYLAALRAMLTQGDPGQGAAQFMEDTYRAIVTDPASTEALGTALQLVATSPGPVLVHCAAGKDRTGLLVSTAQRLVGVPTDRVEADFLYSNRAADQHRIGISADGLDPAYLQPLRRVSLRYLHAAWEEVDAVHGGFDGYRRALGVDDALLAALRARLAG